MGGSGAQSLHFQPTPRPCPSRWPGTPCPAALCGDNVLCAVWKVADSGRASPTHRARSEQGGSDNVSPSSAAHGPGADACHRISAHGSSGLVAELGVPRPRRPLAGQKDAPQGGTRGEHWRGDPCPRGSRGPSMRGDRPTLPRPSPRGGSCPEPMAQPDTGTRVPGCSWSRRRAGSRRPSARPAGLVSWQSGVPGKAKSTPALHH